MKKERKGYMGELDANLDEVINQINSRAKGAPADYTVNLQMAMREFFNEFSEELEYQSTKINRASERRMRVLLRSFYERVYTPYRDATRQSGKGSVTVDEQYSD
jgi:ribosomal protein L16/L10AE